jgi:hypothetical protein
MGQTVKEGQEVIAWVVHPQDILAIWSQVMIWLSESQAHGGGEYSLKDIYFALLKNTMQLILVADQKKLLGCAVTEVIRYPQKKVLHIVEFGGSSPAWTWSNVILKELIRGAKLLGADSITANTYPAMARALKRYGFTSQAILISRDISNENLH